MAVTTTQRWLGFSVAASITNPPKIPVYLLLVVFCFLHALRNNVHNYLEKGIVANFTLPTEELKVRKNYYCDVHLSPPDNTVYK